MNEIPTYPKPEEKKPLTAVERSLLKPDAFMKPIGNTRSAPGSKMTRVRMSNPDPRIRLKKRRDKRNVQFF